MTAGPDLDVAVVGAGPAGLALAAAAAQVGLRVVVVAPDLDEVWPATYGIWLDELSGWDLDGHLRASWPEVLVRTGRDHRLPRAYGLLDNRAVATELRRRVAHAGGELRTGRVEGDCHFTWGSRVLLADGEVLDARVVVDASGHRPAVAAAPPCRPAVQAAWGIEARFDRPPVEPGTCVLMDWTGGADDDPDPTFLYAMDLGDGVVLAEETSLARRPALGTSELRRRLDTRLAAVGSIPDVVATEVVAIPMGCPLPSPDQPVVAFGAAGGLIHPATGYSLGAAFRLAPVVARELAAARDRRASAATWSQVAWQAVWPAWRRRSQRLERYGLSVLLRCTTADLRAFFDAFFSRPIDQWSAYLAGTLSVPQLVGVMAPMFRAAPPPVRSRLVRGDPRVLVWGG